MFTASASRGSPTSCSTCASPTSTPPPASPVPPSSGEVTARAGEIPRDVQVLVHCNLGGRSARAVAALRDLGYDNVWNIAGGITAWSRKIDTTVPQY
ncbi:MAG TPA: hypothetical protein DIT13_13590 [Verrucomicrobiales bacterium]|nr:hypothetical protein [Verrucomicrobiales bacterium]